MNYTTYAFIGIATLALGTTMGYKTGYKAGFIEGKKDSLQVLINEKNFVYEAGRPMVKPEDKKKFFRIGDGLCGAIEVLQCDTIPQRKQTLINLVERQAKEK